MLAGILSHTLTPRQQESGLELKEDDHVVQITRKGGVLATFLITREHPTIEELQEEADRILETEAHYFDFERVESDVRDAQEMRKTALQEMNR